MKQSDIYYNYFEDVNPQYEDINFNLKDRVDPDEASARLYDALYKTFFYNYSKMCEYGMEKVQIIGQKYSKPLFYSFFIYKEKYSEVEDFILSSDYIGPSIEQARLIGELEDFEIKNFLRISRTLGGHIVWPRGYNMKPTINQVKGGEIISNSGYGFYDRIDWTLFLLKTYYYFIEKSEDPRFDKYKEKIHMSFEGINITENDNRCFWALFGAFNRAKKWFENFETFKNFCDFFLLKNNFVDNNYNVLELTSYFPIKPVNYGEYIKNNIRAISRRNQRMIMKE